MRKKYKPIICPICDEFYFSPLSKEDKEDGIDGLDSFCYVCGWKYDLEQIDNPEFKGKNNATIEELQKQFKEKRALNKKYNYLEANAPKPTPHLCPVCGEYTFADVNDFDICPICGWENDIYGEIYPDSDGGANTTSLNDMKKMFLKNDK